MTAEIISRSEAISRGLKRYFTGKTCKHGHIAQSFVSNCACIECVKIGRERWRVLNLSKLSSQLRSFREKNPDYYAKHRDKNRQSYNKASREWYARDPANVAGIVKKYRKRNPEKIRTLVRNQQARKRAAGSHTVAEIEDLLVKQKFMCAGFDCSLSVRERRHVDHMVPLARGGSNAISNLQILCPKCNQKKNAKDPILWANENGRLL